MYYSQKSFPKVQLGSCPNETIAKSGCKLTSVANLMGKSPVEINNILIKKGGYTNGCLISDTKISSILGLNYAGSTIKTPKVVCIAETDHWQSVGVPQHFFLWRPNNEIVDPLDKNPDWKKNTLYNIVSYRLFSVPELATVKQTVPIEAPQVNKDQTTQNLPLETSKNTEIVQSTTEPQKQQEEAILEQSEPSQDELTTQYLINDEQLEALRELEQKLTPFWEKIWNFIINLFKK